MESLSGSGLIPSLSQSQGTTGIDFSFMTTSLFLQGIVVVTAPVSCKMMNFILQFQGHLINSMAQA